MIEHILANKGTVLKAVPVSPRTLDYLVKAGKIPSVRVGSRRLYDVADVIAALKSGSADPAITNPVS